MWCRLRALSLTRWPVPRRHQGRRRLLPATRGFRCDVAWRGGGPSCAASCSSARSSRSAHRPLPSPRHWPLRLGLARSPSRTRPDRDALILMIHEEFAAGPISAREFPGSYLGERFGRRVGEPTTMGTTACRAPLSRPSLVPIPTTKRSAPNHLSAGGAADRLLGSHDGLTPRPRVKRCALIPNAVEELLRASTRGGAGIAGIPRYARSDFEIDDVAIRAGDLLLLDIGSANHDPAVFIDPDSVDVVRKQAAHLTFGYGAHYCIGASLARIELKTVFTQLIPRFPSMQLTVDPTTLRVRRDVLAGGLGVLPVSW